MYFSSIFITNLRGCPLVGQQFSKIENLTIRDTINEFYTCLSKNIQNKYSRYPIISNKQNTFCYVIKNNIYFGCSLVQRKASRINIMLTMTYLHKIAEILQTYLKKDLNESIIKENILLIYELLNEICPDGLPQIIDNDTLRQTIDIDIQPSKKPKIDYFDHIFSCGFGHPWRQYGIKYDKQEINIKMTEIINLQINKNKHVINWKINGKLTINAKVSDNPSIELTFNQRLWNIFDMQTLRRQRSKQSKILKKPIHLLHSPINLAFIILVYDGCVNIMSRFRKNAPSDLMFTPPDSAFDAMGYILEGFSNINECHRYLFDLNCNKTDCFYGKEYVLEIVSNFEDKYCAKNVNINIPIDFNKFSVLYLNHINSKVGMNENNVIWRFEQFYGRCRYLLNMKIIDNKFIFAAFIKQIEQKLINLTPKCVVDLCYDYYSDDIHNKSIKLQENDKIRIKFSINNFLLSGFKIESMGIWRRKDNDHIHKSIQYNTISGSYTFEI